MRLRTPALVALLAASAGATAQAQQFSYAPGSAKYRLTSTMHLSQEQMGQKVEGDVNTNELVTFELAPKTKDTLAFTVTIDSASLNTTLPPQGLPDMAKRIGAKMTGTMSPLGKVYSFQLPTVDDAAGGSTFQGYKSFLIRFPSGALKAGMNWVDTTDEKVNQNGMDVASQTIVTSKVVGDTTISGQKAWKIQRNSVTTLSGSGNQGGQALVLEGKQTGSATEFIGSKGMYLGSEGTTNADMNVNVPGMGMTIPITRQGKAKVELVSTGK